MQADTNLAITADLFAHLARAAKDCAVFAVDDAARIRLWNEGAAALFGYAAHEIMGEPYGRLCPAAHGPIAGSDAAFVRSDGSRFDAAVIVAPIAGGTAVTVRPSEEAAEERAEAQRLEAIGRLAGGVAHDFNNLLTAIMSYAEVLLAEMPESDPLRDDITEIYRAGERASSLTQQLLAFSRRQAIEPRVLDLHAVVGEAERALSPLLPENVRLEVKLKGGAAPVLADPSQLAEVIMSLALHARDAMPRGGALTITTADVGPHVLLSVTDTGEGMDAESRARIFEPFYASDKLGRGTGLGLATVYGIVKQNAWSVEVWSEPGRGSVFKVCIPRL